VRKLNEIGIQKARSVLCFRIKSGKEGVVTNEKVLLIVMLIIAMGLVGCPRRYYDRDRHDQDRGRDREHHR
jgi:hypothetical protein